MIDLPPAQLAELRAILARHLPEGCGVLVFGSRVKGEAKTYSDLDLALVGAGPLGVDCLGCLREAFAESSLPIRVDILDWHAVPLTFQKLIAQGLEILINPAFGWVECRSINV